MKSAFLFLLTLIVCAVTLPLTLIPLLWVAATAESHNEIEKWMGEFWAFRPYIYVHSLLVKSLADS